VLMWVELTCVHIKVNFLVAELGTMTHKIRYNICKLVMCKHLKIFFKPYAVSTEDV
jgi:hypothetical protein